MGSDHFCEKYLTKVVLSPSIDSKMNAAANTPRAFLSPSTEIPGNFSMRDARNELIDESAGPREFMIRAYLAMGFRVFDENGSEASA